MREKQGENIFKSPFSQNQWEDIMNSQNSKENKQPNFKNSERKTWIDISPKKMFISQTSAQKYI